MHSLFKKYRDRTLQYGVYDCNLMVLEHLGSDISKLPEYSTLEEGRETLSEAYGVDSPEEAIHSLGCEPIEPLLAFDGDILVKGIHCFIYYDGLVFGLDNRSQTFQFMKVSLDGLLKFKAYRKTK